MLLPPSSGQWGRTLSPADQPSANQPQVHGQLIEGEPMRGREGRAGGLLTLVHRGRVMLVLAANCHLYIWPSWQLHPMTASFRKFWIWQSFATVKEAKREILGKVLNKEPQSADHQRAAAGIDNTGSTYTSQMHLKYWNTGTITQSRAGSVTKVSRVIWDNLSCINDCVFLIMTKKQLRTTNLCHPELFQCERDSSDQASSATFVSEMILQLQTQMDFYITQKNVCSLAINSPLDSSPVCLR